MQVTMVERKSVELTQGFLVPLEVREEELDHEGEVREEHGQGKGTGKLNTISNSKSSGHLRRAGN